jgi:hypothetical protein
MMMRENETARPLADLKLQAKSVFLCLALICSSFIAGCGGLGYTPPPGAKLGDAFLSLKISTDNRGPMPQGADIVISIENASAANPKDQVIIGDVVKLSQGDTGVKVNFPIDQNRLEDCGKTKSCYIYVKIVKDGTTYYNTTTPASYKAGQIKAEITISKAS